MLNRKTMFILTFILATSLVLAGCSTQAAATQAPAEQPASEASSQAAPTQAAGPAPTDAPAQPPTTAPTEAAAAAPAAAVSFVNDVMPIIQSRCVRCHGEDRVEEGLLMRTYEEIMAGSENGPVIVPGDPANSKLVELIVTQEMPKRGPKLTPPQVQIISDWVAAGALNN